MSRIIGVEVSSPASSVVSSPVSSITSTSSSSSSDDTIPYSNRSRASLAEDFEREAQASQDTLDRAVKSTFAKLLKSDLCVQLFQTDDVKTLSYEAIKATAPLEHEFKQKMNSKQYYYENDEGDLEALNCKRKKNHFQSQRHIDFLVGDPKLNKWGQVHDERKKYAIWEIHEAGFKLKHSTVLRFLTHTYGNRRTRRHFGVKQSIKRRTRREKLQQVVQDRAFLQGDVTVKSEVAVNSSMVMSSKHLSDSPGDHSFYVKHVSSNRAFPGKTGQEIESKNGVEHKTGQEMESKNGVEHETSNNQDRVDEPVIAFKQVKVVETDHHDEFELRRIKKLEGMWVDIIAYDAEGEPRPIGSGRMLGGSIRTYNNARVPRGHVLIYSGKEWQNHGVPIHNLPSVYVPVGDAPATRLIQWAFSEAIKSGTNVLVIKSTFIDPTKITDYERGNMKLERLRSKLDSEFTEEFKLSHSETDANYHMELQDALEARFQRHLLTEQARLESTIHDQGVSVVNRPAFNGIEHPSWFIHRFMDYAAYLGKFSVADYCLLWPQLMHGAAKVWYEEQDETITSSWRPLLTEFKMYFCSKNNITIDCPYDKSNGMIIRQILPADVHMGPPAPRSSSNQPMSSSSITSKASTTSKKPRTRGDRMIAASGASTPTRKPTKNKNSQATPSKRSLSSSEENAPETPSKRSRHGEAIKSSKTKAPHTLDEIVKPVYEEYVDEFEVVPLEMDDELLDQPL